MHRQFQLQMSFQDRVNAKSSSKKVTLSEMKEEPKSSLLINSSFNIGKQQKSQNKEITFEVLKKVSQTIVSLHQTLVPKTQNIQIYRDLTDEEQKMMRLVQDNKLIHTILAGVMAIDSCFKYINREQTYVISSLMKGVTICLGNYKKLEEEYLGSKERKISQNFLKFYDSFKLIISQIHKIPAAKIKKNQIQKHNDLIGNDKLNDQLINTLNRQQNLLFAFLAQENNSLRIKLKDLEKEINQLQKEKEKIVRSSQHLIQLSQKKILASQNNITSQTGSESNKGISQESLMRELKEQIKEKSDIIRKMNDEFAVEMDKYQKVFKRLEEENKLLKKYNDLDTAYILEQLQFEVERLRDEKKNDQTIITQIMDKMDRMSWNRMDQSSNGYKTQDNFQKDIKPRYEHLFNQKMKTGQDKNYQGRRNRCPSVSPSSKNAYNRVFSPNYSPLEQSSGFYNNQPDPYQYQQYRRQPRNNSPKFGNNEQKPYEPMRERASISKQRKNKYLNEVFKDHKKQFTGQEQLLLKEMKKSQTNFSNNMNMANYQDPSSFQINKLRKQIRKSKILGDQFGYMN